MAVSGLEQRQVPLVLASNVWMPWGPGVVTPWREEDYDEDYDALPAILTPKRMERKRSFSWGGFATHNQMTRYMSPSGPHKAQKDEKKQGDKLYGELDLQPEPEPSSKWKLEENLPHKSHKAKAVKTMLSKVEVSSKAVLASQEDATATTTLAIRNLPYSLSQQELLKTIDGSGFGGLYDFLYLPHKFKEHKNLGFAFINFVDVDAARKFMAEWHHTRRFAARGGVKPINISAATVQGRHANETKACSHKMGRVKNSFYRPLLVGSVVSTSSDDSGSN